MDNTTKKENVTEEKKDVLVLKTPINFEGKVVEEIDLSKLNDATGADLIAAKRMMNMNGTALDAYPERTLEYAVTLAAVVTKKPVELFTSLKAKDAMEFQTMVRSFLY